MNNSLNFLFEEIDGQWIYNQTFYCLNEKIIKKNKYKINIKQLKSYQNLNKINILNKNNYEYEYKKLNKIKVEYKYFYEKKNIDNVAIIQKNNKLKNIKYNFQLYKKKYLKINYNEKIFNYSEYIYFINKNLRISFMLIKKFNKCIAISFTSQIKINI